MSSPIQSPVFESLDKACDDVHYWWNTTGRELGNMLHVAKYPEAVQQVILRHYHDVLCPLLGARPDKSSTKAGCPRGMPLEYSFELKESTPQQAVRFVVDLSQLRPVDKTNPLSIENTQKVLDILSTRSAGFDDTWFRILKDKFVYAHVSPREQEDLIARSDQHTSILMGYDISPQVTSPDQLPVMGKVYLPPHHAAVHKGITAWQVVRRAIHDLPGIEAYANILRSMEMINEYLSEKPEAWQKGTQYLATDLVSPDKARFKVYQRCVDTTFEGIWDFYTLGGRIPNLDDDKQKFQDLMDLLGFANDRSDGPVDPHNYSVPIQKRTAMYFAVSQNSPYPTPKLCIFPSSFARNDRVTAQGLETWLRKYGWNHGDKTIEQQVANVFTHRDLDEKAGIFTFIGIGRKEDLTRNALSMQVYLGPELGESPDY